MTEITCKSYVTYSILFQSNLYTVNTTCLNAARFVQHKSDPRDHMD